MKKAISNSILFTIMIFTTTIARAQFSKDVFVSQSGDSLLYQQLQPQSIDTDT